MLQGLTKKQLITRCSNLEGMLFNLQTHGYQIIDKNEFNYCSHCEDTGRVTTIRTCLTCKKDIIIKGL